MPTSTSEAHVSSYQVKQGSPYIQKRRRMSIIYILSLSMSLVMSIRLWCILWSLTIHCLTMVKLLWLKKYLFQLHNQINDVVRELKNSINPCWQHAL